MATGNETYDKQLEQEQVDRINAHQSPSVTIVVSENTLGVFLIPIKV